MKFGDVAATLGTWPSGRCARVLVIYGLLTYFAVRVYRGGRSMQAWVLAAAFVSLALTMQAYARLNNMEHCFTDVIGGALVVVWENSWAARLAAAIRSSHGTLIEQERIPHETVLRAIAALDEE